MRTTSAWSRRATRCWRRSRGKGTGPVPVDDEIGSLSAILLDDAYYHWSRDGRVVVEGLSIVRAEHLIPLKARAWLDLSDRREAGGKVDGREIKKHRNDVFRLYGIADPDYRPEVPATIREDMARFLSDVRLDSLDLKQLGLPGLRLVDACDQLARRYAV